METPRQLDRCYSRLDPIRKPSMEIIYVQSITVLECAVDEDAGVSQEAFASRHRQSVRREPIEGIEL